MGCKHVYVWQWVLVEDEYKLIGKCVLCGNQTESEGGGDGTAK